MNPDSETVEALRRAGRRVLYHLMRAAVEGLKAVEAVVDELGQVRRSPEAGDGEAPEHIEVE